MSLSKRSMCMDKCSLYGSEHTPVVQIFYDPHELMASLVDARNLSYSSKPDNRDKTFQ